MIPTLIVLGLVLGRWWKTALLVGVTAWPALLLLTDAITVGKLPVAAWIALLNTGAGVLAVQTWLKYRRVAAANQAEYEAKVQAKPEAP